MDSQEDIKKNMNKSVSLTLDLLNCMAKSSTPLRLNQIASELDAAQSTILRYLNSLIYEGYAFQYSDTEKYALTWKIGKLSDNIKLNMPLRTLANDLITELASKLDLGVGLITEIDMECIYLDCIFEPTQIEQNLIRIGKMTPMYASGSGKILLSNYNDGQLENFFEKKTFEKLTENTISNREELLEELSNVREQGYAIDDEEVEDNLRCISVPILDYNNETIAALSAFGPTFKYTKEELVREIYPLLAETAREISKRLGADL